MLYNINIFQREVKSKSKPLKSVNVFFSIIRVVPQLFIWRRSYMEKGTYTLSETTIRPLFTSWRKQMFGTERGPSYGGKAVVSLRKDN